MDDDWSANWADGGCVEVKGDVEVFPVRHVRGKGGLAEEVQGEFGLQEELVPEEVGEGIGDAGKDGEEVGFKSAYGAFRYIAATDILQDNLEGAVPLVNDGAAIIDASLIVKDLEINAVALGFEARHDDVVGINSMPVVA